MGGYRGTHEDGIIVDVISWKLSAIRAVLSKKPRTTLSGAVCPSCGRHGVFSGQAGNHRTPGAVLVTGRSAHLAVEELL